MSEYEQTGAEVHGRVKMTEQGLIVPALVVTVGQACSLKCKHCANFSPYAPEAAKHYPLEQILKDLRILFRAAYHFQKMQIQGGEPFLYKELPALLDFVRECGKVTTLTIATNGTIIPSNAVLQSLKKNHVRVRISDYPVTPPEKVEHLKEKLHEFGIDIWVYNFTSNDSMWFDMGGISTTSPHMWQESELQRHFLNCPFHDCFTLENSRISRCSRAVIAAEVQGFAPRELDTLPVVWTEDFPAQFQKYLETPAYMEACRHCLGSNGEKVLPAQQLK